MIIDTCSARERWLAVLSGEKPDRIPLFYSATAEAHEKLLRFLGVGDYAALCDRLHIDKTYTVKPRYVGPPLAEQCTIFGARYKDIHYNGGVYSGIDGVVTHHPLAAFNSVQEIEAYYQWPSPDWWDYSELIQQIQGKEDWVIFGGGSEPFMDYKEQLRGPEQAFIDLVENPEIVHYCLQKLYHLAYENTRRIYEAIPGQVLLSYVAEDMGTQESLLYAPQQIRSFFWPHIRRMIELVHQASAYVIFHSDGAIRSLIPDLIDLGVDVLNPVQWRCKGMDRKALARDFGRQLAFHGAMDNQFTLAFGSTSQVRREVEENMSIFADSKGYFLGPCHNIQVVSPADNIVAMYEAAWENGTV